MNSFRDSHDSWRMALNSGFTRSWLVTSVLLTPLFRGSVRGYSALQIAGMIAGARAYLEQGARPIRSGKL